MEQPTTFELVVNLKTAQALGLTMLIAPLPGGRGDPRSLGSSCVCARRSSCPPGQSAGHVAALQRFGVGYSGTLRAASGLPTTILEEAPEVMSRDREHTMRQSAAVPDAAVYRSVSTEDPGNSGAMPMHLQSCQTMAARDAENWQADARHAERSVGQRVAR